MSDGRYEKSLLRLKFLKGTFLFEFFLLKNTSKREEIFFFQNLWEKNSRTNPAIPDPGFL